LRVIGAATSVITSRRLAHGRLPRRGRRSREFASRERFPNAAEVLVSVGVDRPHESPPHVRGDRHAVTTIWMRCELAPKDLRYLGDRHRAKVAESRRADRRRHIGRV
jgi:hypothetical protein